MELMVPAVDTDLCPERKTQLNSAVKDTLLWQRTVLAPDWADLWDTGNGAVSVDQPGVSTHRPQETSR
jgi:hypothetical protein